MAPDGYELDTGPGGLPLVRPSDIALRLRRALRQAASDHNKGRRYSTRAWLENRRGPPSDDEWPRWIVTPVPLPVLARCERCRTLNRVEVHTGPERTYT